MLNRISPIILLLLVSFSLIGGVLLNSMGLSAQLGIDLKGSLVANWKFDEGEGDITFDKTRNNNDMGLMCDQENCSLPKWVAGKIGYGLEFDGVDDYGIVIDHASLNLIDKLTIVLWLKTTSVATQFIAGKYAGQHGYVLYLVDGKARMDGRDGSGKYRSSGASSTSISDGNWHHIAAVVNVNLWEIWVDGVKESTASTKYFSTDLRNSIPFSIGKWLYKPSNYFKGTIDELYIYDKALTEEEIRELYKQGIQKRR